LPLIEQDHRFRISHDGIGVLALRARISLAEGSARERDVAENDGGAAQQFPAFNFFGMLL
jgi:hypothetical protein